MAFHLGNGGADGARRCQPLRRRRRQKVPQFAEKVSEMIGLHLLLISLIVVQVGQDCEERVAASQWRGSSKGAVVVDQLQSCSRKVVS